MASFSVDSEEGKIVERLAKESDRAVAILGGCLLETRIETAIKAKLRTDDKLQSSTFGVNCPLGTFSAKNDMAFLLRCYGRLLHTELDVINNIRNKFAHYFVRKGHEIHDFKSPLIMELCKQLKLIENYVLTTEEFEKRHGKRQSVTEIPRGTMWGPDPQTMLADHRQRFISTVGLFTCYLGIYPRDQTYIQLIGDEPKPALPIFVE
jgi:hypothetical protein